MYNNTFTLSWDLIFHWRLVVLLPERRQSHPLGLQSLFQLEYLDLDFHLLGFGLMDGQRAQVQVLRVLQPLAAVFGSGHHDSGSLGNVLGGGSEGRQVLTTARGLDATGHYELSGAGRNLLSGHDKVQLVPGTSGNGFVGGRPVERCRLH